MSSKQVARAVKLLQRRWGTLPIRLLKDLYQGREVVEVMLLEGAHPGNIGAQVETSIVASGLELPAKWDDYRVERRKFSDVVKGSRDNGQIVLVWRGLGPLEGRTIKGGAVKTATLIAALSELIDLGAVVEEYDDSRVNLMIPRNDFVALRAMTAAQIAKKKGWVVAFHDGDSTATPHYLGFNRPKSGAITAMATAPKVRKVSAKALLAESTARSEQAFAEALLGRLKRDASKATQAANDFDFPAVSELAVISSAAKPTKMRASKRTSQEVSGVRSYRSRKVRSELPADTFFACDHPLVGRQVPGKPPRGGLVSGCVTPSKKHPRELQLQIGLPGLGKIVRSSTIKNRFRDGRSPPITADEKFKVAQAVSEYRTSGVPFPVGRVHPGRRGKSKCDPENSLWLDYGSALDKAFAAAGEYCATHRCDSATEGEIVREQVLSAPLGALWGETTENCVRNYESKTRKTAGASDAAQMAEWKREYLADWQNDQNATIASPEFRDFIRERGWDDSGYTKKLKAKKRAKIKARK